MIESFKAKKFISLWKSEFHNSIKILANYGNGSLVRRCAHAGSADSELVKNVDDEKKIKTVEKRIDPGSHGSHLVSLSTIPGWLDVANTNLDRTHLARNCFVGFLARL